MRASCKEFPLYKYLITVIAITILLVIIFLNFYYKDRSGRHIFTIFVILFSYWKIWETFYSTKEKKPREYSGDWTLMVTTILYFVMGIIAILEFFMLNRKINLLVTYIASLILILSLIFRRWGIRTLGDQWAVHVTGEQKIPMKKLVTKGPYRFVRHPIYMGTVIEVLSAPLISNSYFAFLFALYLNVPMYFVRALIEEKMLIKEFGEEYIRYKNITPAFIPILKKKIKK